MLLDRFTVRPLALLAVRPLRCPILLFFEVSVE